MTKLALAFTCVESMYSRFFAAWQDVEVGPPSEVPRHVEVGGSIVHARNEHVRWFLEETDAGRLVLLDQDHRFPPNFLERIAGYTEPVVGALYYGRGEPYAPIALGPNRHWKGPDGAYQDLIDDDAVWGGDWEGGKLAFLVPSQEAQVTSRPALYRVLVVGAGCLSIRRDVLEEWPVDEPVFNFATTSTGAAIGEDVWFCQRCAERGVEVFLDSGVVLPHMTVAERTRVDYRQGLRRLATSAGVPFA